MGYTLLRRVNGVLYAKGQSMARCARVTTPIKYEPTTEHIFGRVCLKDKDITTINKLTVNGYWAYCNPRNGGTISVWKKKK